MLGLFCRGHVCLYFSLTGWVLKDRLKLAIVGLTALLPPGPSWFGEYDLLAVQLCIHYLGKRTINISGRNCCVMDLFLMPVHSYCL